MKRLIAGAIFAALLAIGIASHTCAQWSPASILDLVTLVLPAEFVSTPALADGKATFTVTRATQTANRLLAGPSSGSPATPTFRAVVAADLPAHDAGIGSAPGIAAGAGAGTLPTVTLASGSTDRAGQISVLTGSSAGTSAAIATVTFASPYATAPFVVFSPANANAAGLAVTKVPNVTSGTTSFALNAAASALADTTTYLWNYRVCQ